MARILHGMPIETLPDSGDLSPEDQVVAYKADTGKAYRSTVAGLGESANQNISDEFTVGRSYEVGEYCIHDNILYKCTTAHTGDWNENDFEKVTVSEELSNQASETEEYMDKILEEMGDMVLFRTSIYSKTVTISANSAINVSSYVSAPSTPSGYTRLFNTAYGSGSAEVISCGLESTWIRNTASTSQTVTPRIQSLFVKNVPSSLSELINND